jgi:spore coat polysaccharide biosynthesis protein SpsF
MTLAVIQARLNSRRFPGKVLEDLAGVPVLKRVIDRVGQAEEIDRVVVATAQEGGRTIAGCCGEWETTCVISTGDEDDVVWRFVKVARHFKADRLVRVCGDNPLISPSAIDALCRAQPAEYIGYRFGDNTPAILQPTGYFAELVTADALSRADLELPQSSGHRPHVTSWMYKSDRYGCRWLDLPDWYERGKHPDAAIDTPGDLDRVEALLTEGRVPD